MNDTDKRYYYESAQFLDWDEFQACMIQPDDDGETCEQKIQRVCGCFPAETLDAFDYFKTIYDDIPDQHKMRCLLNCVYQNYNIEYFEILEMIRDYVDTETQEARKYRLDKNRDLLKDLVEDTDAFTVYRGTAEGGILPDDAISWTLNKETAQWFVEHHKVRHQASFGIVSEQTVGVADVLFYSNERDEAEVYMIPQCIRDGCMPLSEEWLFSFDENQFGAEYDDTEEYQAWIAEKEAKANMPDTEVKSAKRPFTSDVVSKIFMIAVQELGADSPALSERINELTAEWHAGRLDLD